MGRRTFSKEYKLQTIKQVTEQGKRVIEVSRMLGIAEQTVYRWLREYDKYGDEAFKGPGNARVDNEYKIKVLEKRNEQLEQENKILKKYQTFLKGRRKKK
jgi:transposase